MLEEIDKARTQDKNPFNSHQIMRERVLFKLVHDEMQRFLAILGLGASRDKEVMVKRKKT